MSFALGHRGLEWCERFVDPLDAASLPQGEISTSSRVSLERQSQHRSLLRFVLEGHPRERVDDQVEPSRRVGGASAGSKVCAPVSGCAATRAQPDSGSSGRRWRGRSRPPPRPPRRLASRHGPPAPRRSDERLARAALLIDAPSSSYAIDIPPHDTTLVMRQSLMTVSQGRTDGCPMRGKVVVGCKLIRWWQRRRRRQAAVRGRRAAHLEALAEEPARAFFLFEDTMVKDETHIAVLHPEAHEMTDVIDERDRSAGPRPAQPGSQRRHVLRSRRRRARLHRPVRRGAAHRHPVPGAPGKPFRAPAIRARRHRRPGRPRPPSSLSCREPAWYHHPRPPPFSPATAARSRPAERAGHRVQ